MKTCVALAGGVPPNPEDGGAGVDEGGWKGEGLLPGPPNICVNSPGVPEDFDGVDGPDGGKAKGDEDAGGVDGAAGSSDACARDDAG